MLADGCGGRGGNLWNRSRKARTGRRPAAAAGWPQDAGSASFLPRAYRRCDTRRAPPAAVKPAAAATPAAGDRLAGEVMPQLLFLKDKNGNMQAVPNLTLEELTDLWKQRNSSTRRSSNRNTSSTDLTSPGPSLGNGPN